MIDGGQLADENASRVKKESGSKSKIVNLVELEAM